MAKIDLSKLSEEIDKRKRDKTTVSESLGEIDGNISTPKNKFLNELLQSLETGKPSPSTQRIGLIDEKVSEKFGEKIVPRKQPQTTSKSQSHLDIPEERSIVDLEKSREDALYEEFKRRQSEYSNRVKGSYEDDLLNELTGKKQPQQPQPTQSGYLNEGHIVNNVKKVVDNYLAENFSVIVEETIKDSIIEMYAIERIKNVLSENKDLIKSVVIETIRELQAKKKNSSS